MIVDREKFLGGRRVKRPTGVPALRRSEPLPIAMSERTGVCHRDYAEFTSITTGVYFVYGEGRYQCLPPLNTS